MKIKSIILILPIAAMLSCNTQKMNESADSVSENSKMESPEIEKSQLVKLKKGELLVAVVGYQMAGKESLLQEYFGMIFPPAQKNGFTPLGQLPIDEVASGNFTPNEFIGLFKWPNMESVQAFMGEISPEKLTELRGDIWSELKQHIIAVTADTELTLTEGKVYEVKMLWVDEKINTATITENGGTILINDTVAGYEDLGKNEAPTHLMIIEWDSKDSAQSFKMMNSLKFKKQEAFYTHFDFPEKE